MYLKNAIYIYRKKTQSGCVASVAEVQFFEDFHEPGTGPMVRFRQMSEPWTGP